MNQWTQLTLTRRASAHVHRDGSVAVFLSQRELADAQEGFDDFWAAVSVG